MELVIGNQRYSSWSLRPWFLLKQLEIPFECKKIYLHKEGYKEKISRFGNSKTVPILVDNDFTIPDSLSITEYIHEKYPNKHIWPEKFSDRFKARTLACQMHSSFFSIRNEMPMNCLRDSPPLKKLSDNCLTEIQIIDGIWQELLKLSNSDFLFSSFSALDAFYAPLVFRFTGYQVSLSSVSKAYCQYILNNKCIKEWLEEAQNEKENLAIVEEI